MAVYVTSDLHGAEKEFHRLLADVSFGEEDTLYVLGDVIDRNGDGGVELLRWMMNQPNVELLRGNHEAMLLACRFLLEPDAASSMASLKGRKLELAQLWMRNGGACTLNSLRELGAENDEILNDLLDYLLDCPLYFGVTVDDRDYLLVHSGLGGYREDKKIREYSPSEILWTRPSPNDVYSREFHTILGHTPTVIYGEKYRGIMFETETWTNIDTGAAMGLSPMLLRLDDMKAFY